jgi:translation elongation factor P/translation initiation factor 5A
MDLETFENLSIVINDDAEQKIEEGAEVLYLNAMGRYKFM